MTIRLTTLSLIAFVALAGCERVQGAGQDITTTGQVVQKEAKQAQSNLN